MEKKPKNILLTDDHFVVRQGLKMLIAFFYPHYKVLEASELVEARQVLTEKEIDLLILDATFPEGSSLSEIKNLKQAAPDVKILIYTALEEQTHGPLYLNAGADGFLSKLAEEGEIKIAIQDMLENGSYMNRSLKDKIVQAYLQKSPSIPFKSCLNRRCRSCNSWSKAWVIWRFAINSTSNLLRLRLIKTDFLRSSR
jgi:DNA-binding NarL/FixJ family response regulator